MKAKRKVIFFVVFVVIGTIFFLVLWVLYNLGTSGTGPLAFVGLNRQPIQITEDIVDYNESEFVAEVDSQKIIGKLFIPNNTDKYEKIIVFSHGFGSSAAILEAKAKSLAQSGIPALVYDFRGGSKNSKSDGESRDMSVTTEKADLNAMIDKVKSTQGFTDVEIYLCGESMGGVITTLVASERSDIGGLILCFPAFPSPEYAREIYQTPEDIPETLNVLGFMTGKGFWDDLWHTDIYKAISEYNGDVIILYGTADSQVSLEYMQRANSMFKHSELFILEGAGHGFWGDYEKTSLKTIYQFIVKDR